MEMVEVVIRIPKKKYKEIIEYCGVIVIDGKVIKSGTVLPKGHGDLIDRNSILCDDCSCEQCGHTDECFKLLAPTVINADNEAD